MKIDEKPIRGAFSSEGSLDETQEDEERTFSDSELENVHQTHELASQVKSPSSVELEKECTKQRLESMRSEGGDQQEDEWVDILGNGDLQKKIIRDGNGRRPENGEFVRVSFKNLTDPDREEQVSRFILGYGFSFDAFDVILPLMSVGEQAVAKIHSRFIDNSNRNVILEYELELLDVQAADSIPLSDRVNDAREAGNGYYNKGQYEKAVRLYEYGIRLLSNDGDQVEDLPLRKYTFLSNSCACLIRLKEWKRVVDLTDNLPVDDGLDIDKLILTKIVLRRSDALMNLKQYKDAVNSLKLCLVIDPSNTLAKSQLERAKSLGEKDEKRMKNFYKNMFRALGDKEEGAPKTSSSNANSSVGALSRVKSFLKSKMVLVPALIVVPALLIHFYLRTIEGRSRQT